MILDYQTFAQAVTAYAKDVTILPESHKSTAVFEVGRKDKGHYLRVNSNGWTHCLNGVIMTQQYRIASPLGNLQAAAVEIARA